MKTSKSLILMLLFLSGAFILVGQNNSAPLPTVGTETVVRINLLGIPGFSFEQSMGGYFTFRPEAGLGWPLITEEENGDGDNIYKMESAVNPYVLIEGRYYYNLQRRFSNGKRTNYFGADYLAIYYRYNAYEFQAGFSDNNDDDDGELLRDVQYVVGSWGMQRNMGQKEKFYINWSIGPGIKTNWKDYAEFSLVGQLGLGLQW